MCSILPVEQHFDEFPRLSQLAQRVLGVDFFLASLLFDLNNSDSIRHACTHTQNKIRVCILGYFQNKCALFILHFTKV